MKNFIYLQYKLYTLNQKNIGLEKIKQLADLYLSDEEKRELFGEEN